LACGISPDRVSLGFMAILDAAPGGADTGRTISRRNVEMIQRIFDQAPHDPDVLFESLDDEVQWEVGAIDIPDIGAAYWRGPAGVRESFRRWIGPFDDWGVALDEAIDDREEALEAVGLRK
jgi:hypothetical protein